MDRTKLETINRWAGGTLACLDLSAATETICTDSRALRPGDLFLALRGDNFDGHAFVAAAVRGGAVGAVVEEVPADLPPEFAVIRVADALDAFQKIAGNYRRTLSLQTIGITGSNGKTSTKDFTAAVLGGQFRVLKTEGNLNNHIGVPRTLLRATSEDQVGVIEMGMNHAGEIAPLAAMTAPDVAIITNVGQAHIEHLGSREAIAQEKGMLAEALQPSGTLIVNFDDPFAQKIAARTKADAVFCGIDHGDVCATDVRQDGAGMKFRVAGIDAEISVHGRHMVSNALLAVAAGRVFGLSIEECLAGLRRLRLTGGRLERKLIRGVQVLDDTYNANPDSMIVALRTLALMPGEGRRIAVLGRMGELGGESERGHRQVGETAAQLPIDCVVTVGDEPAWIAEEARRGGVREVLEFTTNEEALPAVRRLAKSGDSLLVKGSRSAHMEQIVEGLATP